VYKRIFVHIGSIALDCRSHRDNWIILYRSLARTLILPLANLFPKINSASTPMKRASLVYKRTYLFTLVPSLLMADLIETTGLAVHNKVGTRTEGPFPILQTHINGTVTIRPGVVERISIRRLILLRTLVLALSFPIYSFFLSCTNS
jgi:hypothetical protein